MIAVAAILYVILEYTPAGRYLFAVGGNPDAARLAGLPVGKINFYSLVASGTISGFAGVLLLSQLGSASYDVGPPYLLPAFSAAFLGATQIKAGPGQRSRHADRGLPARDRSRRAPAGGRALLHRHPLRRRRAAGGRHPGRPHQREARTFNGRSLHKPQTHPSLGHSRPSGFLEAVMRPRRFFFKMTAALAVLVGAVSLTACASSPSSSQSAAPASAAAATGASPAASGGSAAAAGDSQVEQRAQGAGAGTAGQPDRSRAHHPAHAQAGHRQVHRRDRNPDLHLPGNRVGAGGRGAACSGGSTRRSKREPGRKTPSRRWTSRSRSKPSGIIYYTSPRQSMAARPGQGQGGRHPDRDQRDARREPARRPIIAQYNNSAALLAPIGVGLADYVAVNSNLSAQRRPGDAAGVLGARGVRHLVPARAEGRPARAAPSPRFRSSSPTWAPRRRRRSSTRSGVTRRSTTSSSTAAAPRRE